MVRAEGDLVAARTIYEESLEIFIELGSRAGVASGLHNLGLVALGQGLYARAAALLQDSLTEFRELGDRRGVAEALIGLALLAGRAGEPERAARLFATGQAALEAIGATVWPSNQAEYDRGLAEIRAQLGEPTFAAAWSAGQALSLEEAVAEALAAPLPA